MGRRRKAVSQPQARTGTALPLPPHEVRPDNVYRREAVRRLLGLPKRAVAHEIREGRLRVAVIARRYFFLGQWILDWIAANERVRTSPPPATPEPAVSA